MGRIFRFSHDSRALEVRVRPVEEAWELWLFEHGQPVELAATVTIDDAVQAFQDGADLIAQTAHAIEQRFKICESVVAVGGPTTAGPQKLEPADTSYSALAQTAPI